MTEIIRILVVDDHLVVRQGLKYLIRPKYGISIVGEAADGAEAVAMAQTLNPDVILMDLIMPRKSGIEAIREIVTANPQARILVLTSFAENNQIAAAMEAGALGYILKDSSAQDLINAIRQVALGNQLLHGEVARKMHQAAQSEAAATAIAAAAAAPDPLSGREKQVLELLVEGLTNKQIAERLVIAEVTARFHVSSILRKLNLATRKHVIAYALREKLVERKKIGY